MHTVIGAYLRGFRPLIYLRSVCSAVSKSVHSLYLLFTFYNPLLLLQSSESQFNKLHTVDILQRRILVAQNVVQHLSHKP